MSIKSFPWQIGDLPFIYKPLTQPSNGEEIPDFLPFAFDIDEKTGTLVQLKNAYVEQILSKAYSTGSEISGMMDNHGIGELYAKDFLKFLNTSLKTENYHHVRLLEIGCGTGYLLSLLKDRGADVLGIEPGNQGQLGAERFNIPIIRDFFPSKEITGTFDIIILYAILEHISDVPRFFRDVKKHLNQNGKLFISVPDCELYIKTGDLSFIFHEHWSFFTSNTLRNSITDSMNMNVHIEKSHYGGLLYASTSLGDVNNSSGISTSHDQIILAEQFQIQAKNDIERITGFFRSAAKDHATLGIFVPGRAINLLSLMKSQIHLPELRFFDDNPILHRTYYPGFNVPIENRQDLLNNPPELLIIFTHTFGEKIKRELEDSLNHVNIITWDDLFTKHIEYNIKLKSGRE